MDGFRTKSTSAKDEFSRAGSNFRQFRLMAGCLLVIAWMMGFASLPFPANGLHAQEAQWIWHSQHKKEAVPQGECFFRKQFKMSEPERGQILIGADDQYELFVNGKLAGSGNTLKRLDRYNISKLLIKGTNTIAVRVVNANGNTAALAARVQVKNKNSNWQSFSTNKSWRSNLKTLPLWKMSIYNDSRWTNPQSFGQLGSTPPWDRPKKTSTQVAANTSGNATAAVQDAGVEAPTELTDYERFRISREFDVIRVAEDEEVGSVIAFTFNEFGEVIFCREGGGLWLLDPAKPASDSSRIRSYCEEVENCQGLLALNGDLYVTGDGEKGVGLYKLRDSDLDGIVDEVNHLLKFNGQPGEHGPHGLTLGPDGMIYIVLGNHTGVESFSDSSPARHFYEGDLITPRYEDPGGHAVGIKSPGGTIVRTDTRGESVEIVAAGLRNAYDLAFNEEGELFTHDSDMESDIGTSWFRPTTVYHVTSGAEFGWRSGWAKWPDYYVDSLPGVCDTGRGSPTGMIFYDHLRFPPEYQNTMFVGDWSEGRILAIRMKRSGAGFVADSEVFLQGDPLNVTDLGVSPDGSLFFATGGRGTAGGLYRITWKDRDNAVGANLDDPVSKLIRQPQMRSAWARQNIAKMKQSMGEEFGNTLLGVAISDENPGTYRIRALEMMQLYGHVPSTALLNELSTSNSELVRARVTDLLGLKSGASAKRTLMKLLADGDRLVRRRACEALLRSEHQVELADIIQILVSDDRFEAWAGRRLLERTPESQWRDEILATDDQRLFIQGATALMIANPAKSNAYAVLARSSELMDGFVSDRNFVDMVRVMQLALARGEVKPDNIPAFRTRIAEEFPSGNSVMNRELARLLAYLKIHEIGDRYVEYLESDTAPFTDKLHIALHVAQIQSGLNSKQRLAILDFLESSRDLEGSGGSYAHYLARATQEFSRSLTAEDAPYVLARGVQWPNGAVGALFKMPRKLDEVSLQNVKQLDRDVSDSTDESYDQLKSGLIAILARDGSEESMEYLREIWQKNPERRADVAMGLALKPDGENWAYIVSSLGILSEPFAGDVLQMLTRVDRRPTEPEYYRQVILTGLKLGRGSKHAIALLEHWSGEKQSDVDPDTQSQLAAWQGWYHDQYPDLPLAELPQPGEDQKWDVPQLMEYLASEEAEIAQPHRGADVFTKAQCANCHQFNGEGQNLGPDLTSVAKRFSSKEILESIIYPSHVISDQYSAKVVTDVDGRQYSGLLTTTTDGGIEVVMSDGKRIALTREEVESIEPSATSSMPTGLLEELTPEEIADLFAYMGAIQNARVAHRASIRSKQQR